MRISPKTFTQLIVILFAVSPFSQAEDFILIQPGYPGSSVEAQPFVKKFQKTLEVTAKIKLAHGAYHNNEEEALKALKAKPAKLGILSLGMYFKYQEKFKLTPLAWSQPGAKFYLLVRDGDVKSLEELKGKKISGTPFLEPEFVKSILFGEKDEKGNLKVSNALYSSWVITSAKYASRALRFLKRSRRDAVLLSEIDYLGAKKLELLKGFKVLHSTQAYPSAVVVSFNEQLDKDQQKRVQGAFFNLSKDSAGKELLKTMSLKEFSKVDPKILKELKTKFDAEIKKKKST